MSGAFLAEAQWAIDDEDLAASGSAESAWKPASSAKGGQFYVEFSGTGTLQLVVRVTPVRVQASIPSDAKQPGDHYEDLTVCSGESAPTKGKYFMPTAVAAVMDRPHGGYKVLATEAGGANGITGLRAAFISNVAGP